MTVMQQFGQQVAYSLERARYSKATEEKGARDVSCLPCPAPPIRFIKINATMSDIFA